MSTNSPYAPPKSSLIDASDTDIYCKGKYVIHRPDAEWPSRCFKCDTETTLKKKIKLTYTKPWTYLALLSTPIISFALALICTVILGLIFQKRVTIHLPICDTHARKRKNFLIFQWTTLVLLIIGIVVASVTESPALFPVLALVFLALLISAIFGRMITVIKYKQGFLWIKGTGKDFLASLPEFMD